MSLMVSTGYLGLPIRTAYCWTNCVIESSSASGGTFRNERISSSWCRVGLLEKSDLNDNEKSFTFNGLVQKVSIIIDVLNCMEMYFKFDEICMTFVWRSRFLLCRACAMFFLLRGSLFSDFRAC